MLSRQVLMMRRTFEASMQGWLVSMVAIFTPSGLDGLHLRRHLVLPAFVVPVLMLEASLGGLLCCCFWRLGKLGQDFLTRAAWRSARPEPA